MTTPNQQQPMPDENPYEEFLKRQRRLAEQSEDARLGLVERVARERSFKHLDEQIGRRPEDYPDILEEVAEDYLNGTQFLRELSLFYEVSPELSLHVFHLRQEWIKQYGLETVPELMLLDQAMLAYFQVLRLNKEVAATLALTEQSLYYPEGPDAIIRRREGQEPELTGLRAEGLVKNLEKRLMPLIERFHKMFLRNLRAMRELKAGSTSVKIGQVGQVNFGEQQVNMSESPDGPAPRGPLSHDSSK